jgi:hypothetical protein
MSEQQNGVPPASAGGAPAQCTWRWGNHNARNLYWTRLDGTDEHRGVMFDPADGPFVVEALNAQLRVVENEFLSRKPVIDAEILPADRKPAYGEPGLDTDWDEDADAMVIHGVGWNLSWGCKLSIARDHDTGEHYVCVNTSGEDQRKGIVSRSTTREQIASFGQQLLNVFGEPDPRDAEIERLRKDCTGNAEDWKRADAEVTRLTEAAQVNEQRSYEAYAELLNPIREVFGKSPVEASHYRELRDGITRLLSNYSVEATRHEQATAELERIATFVGGSAAMPSSVRSAVEAEIGRRDMKHQRAWEQAMGPLVAERDRLRAKLDQHLADENSAQAANDRLRNENTSLRDSVTIASQALNAVYVKDGI